MESGAKSGMALRLLSQTSQSLRIARLLISSQLRLAVRSSWCERRNGIEHKQFLAYIQARFCQLPQPILAHFEQESVALNGRIAQKDGVFGSQSHPCLRIPLSKHSGNASAKQIHAFEGEWFMFSRAEYSRTLSPHFQSSYSTVAVLKGRFENEVFMISRNWDKRVLMM